MKLRLTFGMDSHGYQRIYGFDWLSGKELTVRDSVLDAIRNGQWDFEPETVDSEEYDSTGSLPGSDDKIKILANRAKDGLPLWHPEDRRSYDDSEQALV